MDTEDIDTEFKTREGDSSAPIRTSLSSWNIESVIDHLEASASADEDEEEAVPESGSECLGFLRWCCFRAPFHHKDY